MTVTAFWGNPDKLYLHNKFRKICDLLAVFLKELLTGIRVSGWRQCDLEGEHQQLLLFLLRILLRILLGLDHDNYSIYGLKIKTFGPIQHRLICDALLELGGSSRNLNFIGFLISALIAKLFDRMDERMACSIINPETDRFLIKRGNEDRESVSAKLSPSLRSWPATASGPH